mmetsp:Transcript_37551/g.125634  ORF Transcript_37551/g.125634 Transcript_37551/m.125634 type:complete len:307 (+) Transcript_37551:1075-1995(+)
MHPQLGKGEVLVRNHAARLSQHRGRALRVERSQLLEEGILEPQVDVPPPQPLVRRRGDVGDGALVHVAHAVVVRLDLDRALLEARVVEPDIVRVRVRLDRLLVREALARDDDILDPAPVAVLLLKLHVLFVQVERLRARQRLERVLVDGARALRLLCSLLELRKGEEEGLAVIALVHLLHSSLKDCARVGGLPLLLLKLGPLDPGARQVVARHVPLEDGARAVGLVGAQLEADVGRPGVVLRLPLRPPVEERTRTRHIAEHLLHVDVLEPKLVHPRHQRDRAIPHVARRVDVPIAHLHLRVLEPQR